MTWGTSLPARADFLVMDGELVYPPRDVYVGGATVVTGGEVAPFEAATPGGTAGVPTSFDLRGLTSEALRFGGMGTGYGQQTLPSRVIEVNQVNSFTTLAERDVTFVDGVPVDEDPALACVVPRAALTAGAPGSDSTDPYRPVVCLVAGFGLRHGGYATSFAHDSHNLFLLGRGRAAAHLAAPPVGGSALRRAG